VGCADETSCANNYKSYAGSEWSSIKKLMPIGIAKDGHPIYGPYSSLGKLW
jgi:hypothetical protein